MSLPASSQVFFLPHQATLPQSPAGPSTLKAENNCIFFLFPWQVAEPACLTRFFFKFKQEISLCYLAGAYLLGLILLVKRSSKPSQPPGLYSEGASVPGKKKMFKKVIDGERRCRRDGDTGARAGALFPAA